VPGFLRAVEPAYGGDVAEAIDISQ
jgi:hypothetical protein